MYVLDSMNVSVLFVKEKMWVLWGRVCVQEGVWVNWGGGIQVWVYLDDVQVGKSTSVPRQWKCMMEYIQMVCVCQRIWAHLGEGWGVYKCVYSWSALRMGCVGVCKSVGVSALCGYSR